MIKLCIETSVNKPKSIKRKIGRLDLFELLKTAELDIDRRLDIDASFIKGNLDHIRIEHVQVTVDCGNVDSNLAGDIVEYKQPNKRHNVCVYMTLTVTNSEKIVLRNQVLSANVYIVKGIGNSKLDDLSNVYEVFKEVKGTIPHKVFNQKEKPEDNSRLFFSFGDHRSLDGELVTLDKFPVSALKLASGKTDYVYALKGHVLVRDHTEFLGIEGDIDVTVYVDEEGKVIDVLKSAPEYLSTERAAVDRLNKEAEEHNITHFVYDQVSRVAKDKTPGSYDLNDVRLWLHDEINRNKLPNFFHVHSACAELTKKELLGELKLFVKYTGDWYRVSGVSNLGILPITKELEGCGYTDRIVWSSVESWAFGNNFDDLQEIETNGKN